MLGESQSEEVTLQVNPGQDVIVNCRFAVVTSQQSLFCREPCYPTTILVGSGNTNVTKGRHSVQFIGAPSGGGSVFVSVAAVTPSDSGRYRCGVGVQTYRTFVLSIAGSEFPVGLDHDSVAQLPFQVFPFVILPRFDREETEPSASDDDDDDSTGWTHNRVHNSRSDARQGKQVFSFVVS